MEFSRQRPGLKLQANPITYALGQIVIAPVLQIENYIPDLQEVLRKTGYPFFEKQVAQSVTFGQDGPKVAESKKDVFLSTDRSRAVSVTPSQLILEVNNYTSVEEFVGYLVDFAEAVREIVQPELFQRTGFRRLNLIEETGSLDALDFLHPGARGLPDAGTGNHGYEFRTVLQDGVHRVIRTVHPAPQNGIPQDLAGVPLEVKGPLTGSSVMLDIDHFIPGSLEFRKDVLVEQFQILHNASDEAFRASVTEQAIAYWEGKA